MTTTPLAGWSAEESPFHAGEQALQERFGVRDKMETIGRRVIRPFMPDQHRDFYAQLPFALLGSLDAAGRPWASVITGQPGFITSPDPMSLRIQAQPLPGDPLENNWGVGGQLGLLGIELETRRRNRANGVVQSAGAGEIAIAVTQSFGNCPQYIQKRQLYWLPEPSADEKPAPQRLTRLSEPLQRWIESTDTFFIATRSANNDDKANQGVDVSHRGGKPGFVRVDDTHTLTFPDFLGNHFFNTLGNIYIDERVGLLFLHFEAGHVLSLTGRAKIIWEGPELDAFKGAERLIQVAIDEVVYLPEALPFRWEFQDYSPALGSTGTWDPETAEQQDLVQ